MSGKPPDIPQVIEKILFPSAHGKKTIVKATSYQKQFNTPQARSQLTVGSILGLIRARPKDPGLDSAPDYRPQSSLCPSWIKSIHPPDIRH